MRRSKVEVRSDCVIFPPGVLASGLARVCGYDAEELLRGFAQLEAEVGAHHQVLVARSQIVDETTRREMSRAPESAR